MNWLDPGPLREILSAETDSKHVCVWGGGSDITAPLEPLPCLLRCPTTLSINQNHSIQEHTNHKGGWKGQKCFAFPLLHPAATSSRCTHLPSHHHKYTKRHVGLPFFTPGSGMIYPLHSYVLAVLFSQAVNVLEVGTQEALDEALDESLASQEQREAGEP